MLLRLRDLHRQLLRASPALRVGAALQDLRAREDPASWLLVFARGGEYVVLGLEDLLAAPLGADLLDRQLGDLALPASPAVPLDTDADTARALLGQNRYLLALRDGQPYGVLYTPPATLGLAETSPLLDMAAGWQAPATVLSERDLPKTPAPRPALSQVQPRPDRYVNTDFAAEASPGQPLDKRQPLRMGGVFWLRFHVGEAEASSIEQAPTVVPDLDPGQDAELRVVVFSESFTLAEDTGVLRVPPDGPASVLLPASVPAGASADDPLLRERLLFRVAIPPGRRGLLSLRVNMYCKGMLVQSRLVTARVGPGAPLTEEGAQQVSVLDYNLSPALAPRHLREVAPHTLSIMLNSDPAGNQSFRLLGQEGQELFANSATLGEGVVASLIGEARAGLRRASWGSTDEWKPGAPNRYAPATAPAELRERLFEDMVNLSARGARLYAAIKNNLGSGKSGAEQLRELMRRPGIVQMAGKISANDTVPIALIYDYRIDSQNIRAICPAFEQSLARVQQNGQSLAGEPCFQGECPSRDDEHTVCPSGFWGFRHDIGVPTPTPFGPEVALSIGYTGKPLIDMAVYTDFALLPAHQARIDGLPATVQRQSSRDAVIGMLKSSQPQLVYFYCHGLLQDTNPTLMIGSKASPGYLTIDNWSNLAIAWPQARPLMFINGCHTTAISPSQALNLVKVLVEETEAAGVIGTEITIVEELAQAFAEALIPLFLGGLPLGRAVREARLRLLAGRNPLGLVYTPHAYAALALVPAS